MNDALHPGLPESVALAQASLKTDATMEYVAQTFLDASKQIWGDAAVNSLHIGKRDAGAAFGLYLIGPDGYRHDGHDKVQHLGNQALILGVAPAFGMAAEAKEQITKHFAEFAHEASSNALIAYGLGALTQFFPGTAGPLAAIGLGTLAKDQLFNPENQVRNKEMWQLSRAANNLNNGQMIAALTRSARLIGPTAYHAGLAAIAGGAGFKPGETLGAAAREAIPPGSLKTAITSGAKSIQDGLALSLSLGSRAGSRPAYAMAHAGETPKIQNALAMSGHRGAEAPFGIGPYRPYKEPPKVSEDCIFFPGAAQRRQAAARKQALAEGIPYQIPETVSPVGWELHLEVNESGNNIWRKEITDFLNSKRNHVLRRRRPEFSDTHWR